MPSARPTTPRSGATAEYTLYTRSSRRAYRQIGSQQTDFLELGGQTLVQLTKVGATTTPVYLHPDLLGSPRKASSGTGALLWQEHYDPYGAKLNGSETTVGYTGHAHDATGLTYMKARFYDPSQHRLPRIRSTSSTTIRLRSIGMLMGTIIRINSRIRQASWDC